MRIPVGFLLEFFRAFLNGTHVLFQVGELSVSRLQLTLFVCQLPGDSLQFFLQLLNLHGQLCHITFVRFQVLFGCR